MSELPSRLKTCIPSLPPPPPDPQPAGQTVRGTHMINTAQLQCWLICICINRGRNNNSITSRDIWNTKECMQIGLKPCCWHSVPPTPLYQILTGRNLRSQPFLLIITPSPLHLSKIPFRKNLWGAAYSVITTSRLPRSCWHLDNRHSTSKAFLYAIFLLASLPL